MIEVKSRTHTNRLFAERLSWTDVLQVVLYCGYKGDKTRIPWYYSVIHSHSCITDLTCSMEQILALMKSNTRNEIRRAGKEGCTFHVTEDIDRFVSFYNAFCASKGLNDYTDKARIQKYQKVLITEARHGDEVLAMHANILDVASKTALLLFSCSPRLDANVDKKMIGWGNRFLHYKDLEYLKENGYELYDWSGVNLDKNSPQYTIGQFKLSFGGKLIESISLKTPLFALLEKIRDRIVRFRH